MLRRNGDLIRTRAKAAFEIATERLIEDEDSDSSTSEVFRYGHLILKGPAHFYKSYCAGIIFIDKDEVDFAFRVFDKLIPGPPGLMPCEVEIIQRHNQMVKELEAKQVKPRVTPLILPKPRLISGHKY